MKGERSQRSSLRQLPVNLMNHREPDPKKMTIKVTPLCDKKGNALDCQPYTRKGYYGISLLHGPIRLHYADWTVELEKSGLLFSNPHVPYAWEHKGGNQPGYSCTFDGRFFHGNDMIRQYRIFDTAQLPLFALPDVQVSRIRKIFKAMRNEMESDFDYRQHVLQNKIYELIFIALKLRPIERTDMNKPNVAGTRIWQLFEELVRGQFPIRSKSHRVLYRSPWDVAEELGIHVNHLNRCLKSVRGMTTSQLISDRIMGEACTLLHTTDWSIAEIGWCLGFDDPPHFFKFFKNHQKMTPNQYRKLVRT